MLLLTLITRKDTMMQYPAVKGLAELLLLREAERSVVYLMALKFIQHSVHAPHNVYMDETEVDDIIGVAGVAATFENWIVFEDRWRKALPKEAEGDFHYTDFWGRAKHSYGANWPDEKRLEHSKELASIIGDCTAFAIGVVISKSTYERFIPLEDRQALISPFHFCLAQCLVGIIDFYEELSPRPPKPMRVMFDRKDGKKQSIGEVYYNVRDLFDKNDILGNISMGERKDEPPLQAADFIIGECRRHQQGRKSEAMSILFKKHPLIYAYPSEEQFAQLIARVNNKLRR